MLSQLQEYFASCATTKYAKKVAYFSMEFALHQALKIYSGGLGFLSGSHMRSAYERKQPLIGIGILWTYGYYDQGRNEDRSLRVDWVKKEYSFLQDIGLKFKIKVHQADVWVKAYYLPADTFQSAPMFLLTTDIPENDYISRTITHRLYDSNLAAKLAQYMVLGIGGATLLDVIGFTPDIYHLNEAHGLPLVFELLMKYQSVEKLQEKLVFTTHTPEEAGNEKHSVKLCQEMCYFGSLPIDEFRRITGIQDDELNVSLVALRLAKLANGVSALHGKVAQEMWQKYPHICPIISITNAQNYHYWADAKLYAAAENNDIDAFQARKSELKKACFAIVADQTGKLFNANALTIVWARRFAAYKRADLITRNLARFEALLKNPTMPVQIIFAGKPYPGDEQSVQLFNHLVQLSSHLPNMAVLTGYELALSKYLKQGSDIWLNNPRVPREASGTSGMTAAMNGSINLTTNDGWIPEFAKNGENCFVAPTADYENWDTEKQDRFDLDNILRILEEQVVPKYYAENDAWFTIVQKSMADVKTAFDSNRMADEYYTKMYEI